VTGLFCTNAARKSLRHSVQLGIKRFNLAIDNKMPSAMPSVTRAVPP
jgi:hypothetical protein